MKIEARSAALGSIALFDAERGAASQRAQHCPSQSWCGVM